MKSFLTLSILLLGCVLPLVLAGEVPTGCYGDFEDGKTRTLGYQVGVQGIACDV